jgi:SAM-dependent methyltransferase
MNTPALIAETNRDQAAEWDGAHGRYWAEHAQQYEASTAAHRQRLLEAAHVQRDSHVLDVGCGTGRLTIEAAGRARSGSALGVDLSGDMIHWHDGPRTSKVSATQPSSKPTPRSTPSRMRASTTSSATRLRCSSATNPRHSPTSPAPFAQTDDSA